MKKILFFSFLLISSIILVASCESGPSKPTDTAVGPNGCSCVVGLTGYDDENQQMSHRTYEYDGGYSRQQTDAVGWTDCSQAAAYLEKQLGSIPGGGGVRTSVTVACLPK